MSRLRVAILSIEPQDSAAWFVRVLTPLAALTDRIEPLLAAAREGTRVSIDPSAIQAADLVLVQRLFPTRSTWDELDEVLRSGKPVVYETDEALLNPARNAPDQLRARLCGPYIRKLLRSAAGAIVPTASLRDSLSAHTRRVRVVPDGVHLPSWGREAIAPGEPVRVGFLGSAERSPALARIEAELLRAKAQLGDRLQLVLIGASTPALLALPGTQILPEPPDYPTGARILHRSGISLALAPADDAAIDPASPRHWLEYSAAGIAGLYADRPVYRDVIESGRTGLLIGDEPGRWTEAIVELVREPTRIHSLAEAARREVLRRHGVERVAPGLADALEELASGSRRRERRDQSVGGTRAGPHSEGAAAPTSG